MKQTATKAQAGGAAALGLPALVVAVVQLCQISLTDVQLDALQTIVAAIGTFLAVYFSTNAPIVEEQPAASLLTDHEIEDIISVHSSHAARPSLNSVYSRTSVDDHA